MEEGTASTNILAALNLFPNPAKSTETSSNSQSGDTSGKTDLLGVVIFSTSYVNVIRMQICRMNVLCGC